uniref:Uncharacterized protein n=1 Tax=Manihot esculenta TaxID=3983 RepID=A0A2C9UW93_MANES
MELTHFVLIHITKLKPLLCSAGPPILLAQNQRKLISEDKKRWRFERAVKSSSSICTYKILKNDCSCLFHNTLNPHLIVQTTRHKGVELDKKLH